MGDVIPVVQTSIGGTRIIGRLVAGKSTITFEYRVKGYKGVKEEKRERERKQSEKRRGGNFERDSQVSISHSTPD